MNDYFFSPQFVLNLICGLLFVLVIALMLSLFFGRVPSKEDRK